MENPNKHIEDMKEIVKSVTLLQADIRQIKASGKVTDAAHLLDIITECDTLRKEIEEKINNVELGLDI